jgi:L-arabinose isomerase
MASTVDLKQYEVWYVTGSQHLYGPQTLEKVNEHAAQIAAALDRSPVIPVRVIWKPVLTGSDEIRRLCLDANSTQKCVGLVVWMHTFSPAKMWIGGLSLLQKPLLHLHTQFNREIPWSEIDMDFMNLNQSAHGDREFGFIGSRLRLHRKVVVGYWQDDDVHQELGTWARAACARADAQGARFARFGDNMRDVAVTEGDKVEAQLRFGYEVNGYGLGDLGRYVEAVPESEVDSLIEAYHDQYDVAPELGKHGERHERLRTAARLEAGIRRFLLDGSFKGFTTTFEDLHGLDQLPGLAAQRLMADGYGYGAEGDWKTAALVRAMKVMDAGLEGGTSFMEDYTYHFSSDRTSGTRILGSHMLEVCETIATRTTKPRLEVHPLSIGGKADPVRVVFDARTGLAIVASIVDVGNRFRMVVNEVDAVVHEAPMPRLPTARALWVPRPDFKTATTAWILAGGAHHTGFSFALTAEHLEDFADMAGIEFLLINRDTRLAEFKKEIRWNATSYLVVTGP